MVKDYAEAVEARKEFDAKELKRQERQCAGIIKHMSNMLSIHDIEAVYDEIKWLEADAEESLERADSHNSIAKYNADGGHNDFAWLELMAESHARKMAAVNYGCAEELKRMISRHHKQMTEWEA